MNLAVGDLVRAVAPYDTKQPEGIGQVISITEQRVKTLWPDWHKGHGAKDNEWNFPASTADTFLEKLPLQFKTGDKVIYIGNNSNHGPVGVGEIIQITNQNYMTARFPEWTGGHGKGFHEWYVSHEELAPANAFQITAVQPLPQEFQVGDLVQRIRDSPDGIHKVGDVGVVIDPPNGVLVNVINSIGDVFLWNAENLIHATHTATPGKFQFGDRVIRVNDNNDSDAKIGQVATVIKKHQHGDYIRVLYPGCKHYRPSEGRYGEAWELSNMLHAPTPPLTEHVFYVDPSASTVPTNTKETPMLKIENRTFINNTDAASFSDDQLIQQISATEKEIEKLEQIATKSDKIAAKIADLKSGAKRLAQILDERDAK